MFDFSSLPFIDNHCHPYRLPEMSDRYTPLDTFLGLRGSGARVTAHRDSMIYQRWATRMLAEFLDCAPDAAAIAAARRGGEAEHDYVARLYMDGAVESLVADMGYPRPPIDLADFRARTPIPVAPIYRIEPIINDLLAEQVGYDAFVERFDQSIRQAIRDERYVALKSIIAYRTGLDIDLSKRDEDAGRRALDRALAEPSVMAASKDWRDHLLCRTLDLSIELDVPCQIHTGFGDAEVVLQRCNPALLNDLLTDPTYARARVILIHSYPYLAEASWMAAAHLNVWCDLSLGIPFAPVAADRILSTALELAPTNRILAGSDAASGPEQVWLGAKLSKAALARVLTDLHARDLVTETEAPEIAAAILAGNARELYRLS